MSDKLGGESTSTLDSIETGEELIKAYWKSPKKFDGLIPPDFKMPEGFVIDGHLNEEIKDIIEGCSVIPLRIGENPFLKEKAKIKIAEGQKLLNREKVLLLASLEESVWSIGFVAESDLTTENPNNLLGESQKALNNNNIPLSNSKMLVYELREKDTY